MRLVPLPGLGSADNNGSPFRFSEVNRFGGGVCPGLFTRPVIRFTAGSPRGVCGPVLRERVSGRPKVAWPADAARRALDSAHKLYAGENPVHLFVGHVRPESPSLVDEAVVAFLELSGLRVRQIHAIHRDAATPITRHIQPYNHI